MQTPSGTTGDRSWREKIGGRRKYCKGNWRAAKAVITNQKAGTAMLFFANFKASIMNDIYPAMLKVGLGRLLRYIFKNALLWATCLSLGGSALTGLIDFHTCEKTLTSH